MKLKLATPPSAYDRNDQAKMRGAIEDADQQNLKLGVSRDHYLLSKPDGTVGKLTVNSSGVLVWTAL